MRHKGWIALCLCTGLVIAGAPAKRRVIRFGHSCIKRAHWLAIQYKATTLEGEPAGWLTVPSCKLNTLVIEGADKKRLYQYPCLEKVGQSDLIMAHRDMHFSPLGKIQLGDEIEQKNLHEKSHVFTCSEIHIIDKDECAALIEKYADKERLLLLTCYPIRHIGPAPQRLLIVAKPADSSS